MNASALQRLLKRVRAGGLSLDDALHELKDLPFADLGYAMVDHRRALRQGVPEVIFGLGKTPEQIVGIARLDQEKAVAVTQTLPLLSYNKLARTATWEQGPIVSLSKLPIALVCGLHPKAGTIECV